MSEQLELELKRMDHHGHSPAAWTSTITMMIGVTFLTVSLFIDWEIGVWVGAVLVLIGVPLGFIMMKMGYGIKGPKYDPFSKDK